MISCSQDIETGEIISSSDDERGLLETIYELYYDEQTQPVDWEVPFKDENIPDWQRERIQDADRVEAGFGGRYIEIPSESSQEGYCDMEAFIDTLRNPR